MIEDLIRRIRFLENQLDDLVKPEVVGPWQDWTPTVTQGVAVTVTVNYARYAVIGNTVVLACELTMTSTGTAGNTIIVAGIPIAPNRTGNFCAGSGYISSGSNYSVAVMLVGASDFRFMGYNTAGYMGASPSLTLAAGNVISFTATYERA